MTAKHLSEAEIQQYAIDPTGMDPILIGHIRSCTDCAAQAEAYLKLFSLIQQEPRPSFDIDLSAIILPQLGKPFPAKSSRNYIIYLFAILALVIPIIATVKYGHYLTNFSTGMLPMTLSLLILTTLCILLFQSIEMFRRYQKQINLLN